jgi:hypothetical protein
VEYGAHCREHTRLRPDGQQNDYVTLPTEEREQGSLEGVPKVYRHGRCGGCTVMPEEIIRPYLKNPFTYMADRSFCTSCGMHVPCRELVWVETGENMQDYNNRLRTTYLESHPRRMVRMMAPLFRLIKLRN